MGVAVALGAIVAVDQGVEDPRDEGALGVGPPRHIGRWAASHTFHQLGHIGLWCFRANYPCNAFWGRAL